MISTVSQVSCVAHWPNVRLTCSSFHVTEKGKHLISQYLVCVCSFSFALSWAYVFVVTYLTFEVLRFPLRVVKLSTYYS